MSQSTFVVSEEVANAFWEKVKKVEDENSCWPWVGGWTDKDGRGRWRLEGKSMISSRAALLISKGPPPNDNWDLQACHTCDNPGCCRPEHLFWGTREQNMRDKARKGRAGIQRHPERYQRPRRPDVMYRPVKQSGAPKGIDSRTWTRFATPKEKALATRALEELETNFNKIGFAPAPQQNFDGHRIRVVESRNPDWYVEYGRKFWRGPRQFDLKRARVVKALKRVVGGRVRGNGYEVELLPFLAERWPEVTD
jgi:hypothetical protein